MTSSLRIGLYALLTFAAAAWAQPAPEEPAPPAVETPKQTRYCVIPLQGVIGRAPTPAQFEAALDRAIRDKVDYVVLDLDVTGGRIGDAEEFVATMIRRSGVRFVAFVRGKAFSAGAPLALCCSRIFMAEDAEIGLATTSLTGTIDPALAIQATTLQAAWVTLCGRAARSSGQPTVLAEAMADPTFDLTMDMKDGRLVFEKNGTGTTVKAKDLLLKMTSRQALACGLAAGKATGPDALGEPLGATGWTQVSAGDLGGTTHPPAADATAPASLIELITKKVAALGLEGEQTSLQRDRSYKELTDWLAILDINNRKIHWTVDVKEVSETEGGGDKEAIKRKLDDAKRSLRDAQARAYRPRWGGRGRPTGPSQDELDEIRKLQRRVDILTAALEQPSSYPFVVTGTASDSSRIEVTAEVHRNSEKTVAKATPGSKLILIGALSRVSVNKDDLGDADYPIRVRLKTCTAEPPPQE